MRKTASALAMLIIGALMLSLLAIPVNATTATSSSWQVGESWAMGKEVDFGSNIMENETEFNSLLQAAINMTIDDFDVQGQACYYLMFKVIGDTATTCTVEAKGAFKLATQVDVSVTGKLPVAGTYDDASEAMMPSSTVPKETKTISLDLTQKLGLVMTSTIIIQKSTMAITNMTLETNAAFMMEVDATNIPEVNSTGLLDKISYKNYDMGVKANVDVVMYMDFAPPLDLFQLPVVQGEVWYTNVSEVTVNGHISGLIDAHGLPDELLEEIFTEELENATGATQFPINLDRLTSPDGNITDGHFGPFTGEVPSMKMKCLNTMITRTVDGESREYLVIEVNDGQRILFSTAHNFISGAILTADSENMPIDMPEESEILFGLLGDDMSMEPMSSNDVASKIASIEDYTNDVANEANGQGSLADFFLRSPYLGTLMLIGAAAAIGVVLFIGTRGRRRM